MQCQCQNWGSLLTLLAPEQRDQWSNYVECWTKWSHVIVSADCLPIWVMAPLTWPRGRANAVTTIAALYIWNNSVLWSPGDKLTTGGPHCWLLAGMRGQADTEGQFILFLMLKVMPGPGSGRGQPRYYRPSYHNITYWGRSWSWGESRHSRLLCSARPLTISYNMVIAHICAKTPTVYVFFFRLSAQNLYSKISLN